MKSLFIAILLSLATLVVAQDNGRIIIDIPTNQKPWNNLDWNNGADNFQFAIVTDRTGGHRPGIFLDGIKKLNLLQPEFVMSVGDLIEGYTEDTTILNAEWKEFIGFIDHLEAPFFYLPGNHDITNKVMEDKWKEIFGVTYYHFKYKDVLFLCLNSEDNYRGAGKGTIDDEQYAFIEKTLAENQDVRYTLVFMHQPLWIQNDTKRWNEVMELLKDRPHNVFAGHYHRYWKTDQNNGKYIALATTGGGSRLRGPAYGEFDHVVWVTMTEEGPILANLLLEGIWDENVVTEEIVDLVRNRPFPIQIPPVYVPDKKQLGMAAEIRITNDSDLPMKVKMEGINHPDLFYQLDQSSIEIGPNSVEIIPLSISNVKMKDISSLNPIEIRTEVTYEKEDRPDVVMQQTLYYLPQYEFEVINAKKKITVDGNLNEWTSEWISMDTKYMTRNPFHYKGKQDFSMQFATAYDENYIYVGVKVTDDDWYQNGASAHWTQDVIIVGLDARPLSISEKNNGYGRNREWLSLLLTMNEEKALYESNDLPEGILHKVNVNGQTATAEMAIPISYLNKMQQQDWKNVRIGIGYYDFDEGGEERNDHMWFPAWTTGETIHGSGMMFKK
jgi:hypothetical protein